MGTSKIFCKNARSGLLPAITCVKVVKHTDQRTRDNRRISNDETISEMSMTKQTVYVRLKAQPSTRYPNGIKKLLGRWVKFSEAAVKNKRCDCFVNLQ